MAINELLSTVLKRQQIQHLLKTLPTPTCLSLILWASWIFVPGRYSDGSFWSAVVIQILILIYLLKSLQKDKPNLASAAKEIDRKLDTKERLIALISLNDEQQNSPLASILRQQLEPFLKDLKLSELIPLQISRVNLAQIILSIGITLFLLNKALTPHKNAAQIALVNTLLNQHQLPSQVEESLVDLVDTLKRDDLSSDNVTDALNAAETALALAESEVLNGSESQEEYLSGDSSPSANDVSNRLPSQGNNSIPPKNAKMPPTSTPTSTPASAAEYMNRKEDQNQKESREQNKEEEKNKAQEVDVQHSKSSQQQGDKSGSKGDKSSEGDESSQSKDTNQGGDKSDKSGSDKDPANKGDQGKSGGSQGQGKDQGQKQEQGQNQGEQQAQGAKSSAQDGAGEGAQPGGQSAGQGEDQQTQQQESQQGKSSNGESSNGESSNGESSGSEAGAKGDDPQGQESKNGGPNNASDKTDSGDEKSRGTGDNKDSNPALDQVKQGLDAIKDAQNKGQEQGQEQQESKKSANDQTQPSGAEGANQKGNSDKQEKSGKGAENSASRPGEVPPPSPSSKDLANRDRSASDARSPSAAKEDNTSKDGKNSPPRKEQVSEQNSEQNNEATEEPDSKKSSNKQEGSGGMALPSEQSQTKEGLPEDGDGPASPQRPPKFQEKQIGEAQEIYDLSATGSEQGRVLNKNDAEYKRRLKELSLSKPAERTDSQPQKVPLEYRGWLK